MSSSWLTCRANSVASNPIRIELPPLRERREDIVPLVDLVLGRVTQRHGRAVMGVSALAMKRLLAHPWPGNVRELVNLLERAVADTLVPADLDFPPAEDGIEALLSRSARARRCRSRSWNGSTSRHLLEIRGGNKADAARILGINRRTLYRKLAGSEVLGPRHSGS